MRDGEPVPMNFKITGMAEKVSEKKKHRDTKTIQRTVIQIPFIKKIHTKFV